MVDDVVRAQFARCVYFAFVASGSDDASLKHLRDLNGSDTDAGVRAENQHRLAGADTAAANEHVPCGQENERDTGGLIEIEFVWNGNDAHCGDGNQFAVTAVHAVADDGKLASLILQSGNAFHTLIAEMHRCDEDSPPGLEASHVFTYFNNVSGDVATQDVREIHPRQ